MIGWTRLVLATAWVMSASFACAGTTPRPSTPDSVRSPPLDYGDGVRSASDGEIMGAHGVSTQDWLMGNATTEHPAPGWSLHEGRLHFESEHVHTGRLQTGRAGGPRNPAWNCLPRRGPLAPEDMAAYAALRRALLEATRQPAQPAFASAVAEMQSDRSGFLSCDPR